MATMITVHGDHSSDVADYLNERLQEVAFRPSDDRDVHIQDALNGVIITQIDHADPNDPVNSERMARLQVYGRTCLACSYYHKVLDLVARVGTPEEFYALIRLIDLHDLDCWGSPCDEE